MGRKSREKKERKLLRRPEFWEDGEGIHGHLPLIGKSPANMAERLTENFQENIRNSPLWTKMVDDFGAEEAEKLLKECKTRIVDD